MYLKERTLSGTRVLGCCLRGAFLATLPEGDRSVIIEEAYAYHKITDPGRRDNAGVNFRWTLGIGTF